MLAPVTHILPLTQIRRERTLPRSGRVMVRIGQQVTAADVIAQVELPSGHLVLDIRRGLRLAETGAAEASIIRSPGDRLLKGDVIAETKGLLSRIIRAPLDSEVVSIYAGKVMLRTRTTLLEVRSGISGTVTEILADRGAVVETNGALIQGVWGNGVIDSGPLVRVAHLQEDLLPRHLDASMRGAVILAETCSNADTLLAAGELSLRGLILSSMAADLIPTANSQKYPVFVLEGFGKIPLNEIAGRLLAAGEKQEISVNAEWKPAEGLRPELVISRPAVGKFVSDTAYFAPGKAVRIQGAPYAGKMGVFVQVRQGRFSLPNGLKVPAAEIQLADDSHVTVPLVNLEVIE